MEDNKREYQKVLEYINELIRDNKLEVGSKLPTERFLAQTLDIGRNSAREALRMLENMGVIESRRGSGNYIVGNISKSISEMVNMMLLLKQTDKTEISSFRRNMEKAVCFILIDNNLSIERINNIEHILENVENLSIEEQINADKDFHYALINETNNQFMITLLIAISDIYRQWIEESLRNIPNEIKKELFEIHRKMIKAILTKDREACEKAIDRHYNIINNYYSILNTEIKYIKIK